MYFGSRVANRKERKRNKSKRGKKDARSGMSGWTNSIVVGRLTTIGEIYSVTGFNVI